MEWLEAPKEKLIGRYKNLDVEITEFQALAMMTQHRALVRRVRERWTDED